MRGLPAICSVTRTQACLAHVVGEVDDAHLLSIGKRVDQQLQHKAKVGEGAYQLICHCIGRGQQRRSDTRSAHRRRSTVRLRLSTSERQIVVQYLSDCPPSLVLHYHTHYHLRVH